MIPYEFDIHLIRDRTSDSNPKVVDRLNELGAEGWQFCTMWGMHHGLFQRPVDATRRACCGVTTKHPKSGATLVTGAI